MLAIAIIFYALTFVVSSLWQVMLKTPLPKAPGRLTELQLDAVRSHQPQHGGSNLIPVAVVRDIRQATPAAGSFVGDSNALGGVTVEVSVTS